MLSRVFKKMNGQKDKKMTLLGERHHACTRWLHRAWFLNRIGSAFGNAEEWREGENAEAKGVTIFLCDSLLLRSSAFQKGQ